MKQLDELRAVLCGVGVVGQVGGQDVILRDSVIELVDRRRASATDTDETIDHLLKLLDESWSLGLTFERGSAYISRGYIDDQEDLKLRISSARLTIQNSRK